MSVIMHAVSGVGSDTNSGSTVDAAPLANGTGAVTAAADPTVDLSADAPDLSGVSVGDTIRLNGRTDGKNTGNPSDIFEITAVNDGADTVDVTPVPDDITGGVTWAIGGCFATVQRLITVGDRDDLLYMRGTFDEAVDGVNTCAGGIPTNPIRVIGYASTPGDGGYAILDSNDTKANGWTLKNGGGYWSYENIKIYRYTAQGFRGANCNTPQRYLNCWCDDINGDGWAAGNIQGQLLIDCYASNCLNKGFHLGENNTFISCVSKDNTDGFYMGGSNTFLYCAAIGNTTDGFNMVADLNHKGNLYVNCLVDGDGKKTGIAFKIREDADALSSVIMNCIAYDCDNGISDGVSDQTIFAPGVNNMVNGCTTAYTNFSGIISSLTTAPSFVGEGANDYTPTAGANQACMGHSLASQSHLTQTGEGGAIGPVEGVTLATPDYPSEDDVRDGVDYNTAANTGNLTLPVAADVEDGKTYGTAGTEFTGTVTLPAVTDVEDGKTYGAAGTELTGTVTLPSAAETEDGVTYGAGGTEFTGTFEGGSTPPLYPLD